MQSEAQHSAPLDSVLCRCKGAASCHFTKCSRSGRHRQCGTFYKLGPQGGGAESSAEQSLKELYKGGNLVFLIRENYVQDDPEIQEAWQRQCDKNTDAPEIRCLVTGQKAPLARLHPAIKGVTGHSLPAHRLFLLMRTLFAHTDMNRGAMRRLAVMRPLPMHRH